MSFCRGQVGVQSQRVDEGDLSCRQASLVSGQSLGAVQAGNSDVRAGGTRFEPGSEILSPRWDVLVNNVLRDQKSKDSAAARRDRVFE
jgi:hypothetical protein